MNWKKILLYGLILAAVLLVVIINTIYQAQILKQLKSMQYNPEDDQQ